MMHFSTDPGVHNTNIHLACEEGEGKGKNKKIKRVWRGKKLD